MNRGSVFVRSEPQSRLDAKAGFNEAPIHESGKCGRSDRSSPKTVCIRFNEAPIHESGKCKATGSGGVVEEAGDASMRPRFMNRGSHAGHGCFRLYICSRGFNEAPIHESGKSDRLADQRIDKAEALQ